MRRDFQRFPEISEISERFHGISRQVYEISVSDGPLCDVANSLTRLIWSLQSEMFVESVRMSSACEKAPR